jgi:hypothetical protein
VAQTLVRGMVPAYNPTNMSPQGLGTTTQDPSGWGVRKCTVEETAYRAWLSVLGPLRWICLGGGVVFSAAAGLSILGESAFFGQNWKLVSALLAFAASALTGLHGILKCDAHQAECHRLIQAFKSLRSNYEASNFLDPQERPKRLQKLNDDLTELTKDAQAIPAPWCYKKAGG